MRKRNRLAGYDYGRAGAYFVTICAKDMKCIFGHIIVGDAALGVPSVRLTEIGQIVDDVIRRTETAYSNVTVPYYVIMPNHLHLILVLSHEDRGTPRAASRTGEDENQGMPRAASRTTIPKIVNALKSL